MRRRTAVAAAVLALSGAACQPVVWTRTPTPPTSPTTSTVPDYCVGGHPASDVPGPGITDPESPMYDPSWPEWWGEPVLCPAPEAPR